MAGLAPQRGLHLPHTVSASRLTSAPIQVGQFARLSEEAECNHFGHT